MYRHGQLIATCGLSISGGTGDNLPLMAWTSPLERATRRQASNIVPSTFINYLTFLLHFDYLSVAALKTWVLSIRQEGD